MKIIPKIIMFFILGIRPLLGPQGFCRFAISCTDYAQEQFKQESFFIAVWRIIIRVLSCNPFFNSF